MTRITTSEDLERIARDVNERAAHKAVRFAVCLGASCIASGAQEVLDRLEEELAERNGTVEVSGTGCMGPCARGPLIRVLPSGKTHLHV
ncbi:MAG: (2Fe-2S) ferredoxin domain-containing protein, partial [Spirochaetota bacterium]